jgi:hypothetical protein
MENENPNEDKARALLFEHLRRTGKPPPLSRMKDDELKSFVQEYVSGAVFTSHDALVHGCSDIGMVFFPLIMGCFEPPEGLFDKPQEPEEPTIVEAPTMCPPPDAPTLPAPVTEAQEALEALESEVAYDYADPKKLQALQTEVKVKTSEDRKEYEAALEAHANVLIEYEAECNRIQAEHDQAVEAYKQVVLGFDKAMEDYEESEAAYQAKRKVWVEAQTDEIGVVWEYHSKSMPRSINGLPCFMSCRIMHKDDWKRATKALDKLHKDIGEVVV